MPETVYCHQCGRDWEKEDFGLVCPNPHCESEFTEIIDPDNDPRSAMNTEDLSPPTPPSPRTRPSFLNHNPWGHEYPDDPEEQEIEERVTRTFSPNGSIQITRTTFRTGPIQGGLLGMTTRSGSSGESSGRRSSSTSGGRFTYNASARLQPRDANNPQPQQEPVDDIASLLQTLFRGMGTYPGSPQDPHSIPHPFNMLSALINPGSAIAGDTVFTQEAFDRVMSQLMEQNSGNGAPPASEAAIRALPEKAIDKTMLGGESKAECTICSDDVVLGDIVTVLPCSHWFHGPCVKLWLESHDTCPICRKSLKDGRDRRRHSAEAAVRPSSSRHTSERSTRSRHGSSSGSATTTGATRSGEPNQSTRSSPRSSPGSSPRSERHSGSSFRNIFRSSGNS
ncbi:MAG: hypothetical protein M1824_000098 [Vezdaea acicularis]|nr:MAG: hypothetical protein M1824_000098 [Vezdaea acicularis]